MKKEIRICGFGGQGIILAGVILGEAAVRAGVQAVQTQSYGPESRGGAARSEVVISSDPIDYPRVSSADVLVALSQTAYDKYREASSDRITLIDQDLVKGDGIALPFTKTAEEVGHQIVANIVMLGALSALLDFIPLETLEQTIARNVPKRTVELNMKAVRAGRMLYQSRALE